LNDIAKSASPPITPAPAPALTEKTNTSLPNETPKNVPDPNSSPLWLDIQPEKDSSQPKTAPLPSPPDVTPPSGSDSSAGTSPNRNNGQYREYPAPRAGLGRPVPESVLAMNERRWSDSSNIATPIIPSSNDVRTGSDINVTNPPAPEKRIINDTTISSIRVAQGETFSSLSQRAYGSEMYAEALAAYNHEAGMVDADQPGGNQTVLIPAKFDLENRFGNLLRKQPFRSAATKATTNSPVNRDVLRPTTATDGPTYRVRKGEQLFDVAKLTLGDGYRWGEIYSLNKDVLHESTELRPEMMLRLPADAKLDNGKPR
jgi:nucleoid-associated protein YgaU